MNLVDVIFIDRAHNHKEGRGFPRYFEYRYNSNSDILLKNALNNDYLRKSDYIFNMFKTKNSFLKQILKDNNLKVSGNKHELIDRLKDNLSENLLKNIFTESYYQLTELGYLIIEENEHLIFYHAYPRLVEDSSLEEFHNEFITHPKESYYDTAKRIQNNIAKTEKENENWGLYRNALYIISCIDEKLGNSQSSIEILMDVCILDMCGLNYGNILSEKLSFLASGIVGPLRIKLSESELTEEDIRELYFERLAMLNLPRLIYNKEKMFEKIYDGVMNFNSKMNNKIIQPYDFRENNLTENIVINKSSDIKENKIEKKGGIIGKIINLLTP